MNMQEIINWFSAPIDQSFYRGNIMSYYSTSNSNKLKFTEYLDKLSELEQYRSYDLVETILDLFSETIKTAINPIDELVTLDKLEDTNTINKILKDCDYLGLIYKKLPDFIYYGTFVIDFKLSIQEILGNHTRFSFELNKLLNEYVGVDYLGSSKVYVLDSNKNLKSLNKSIYFTTGSLDVVLDKSIEVKVFKESYERVKELQDTKDIYDRSTISIGKPLFMNVIQKLKVYAILEQLQQMLTLMKLIEQDTWMIDTQRMSDSDSIIKLCNQVKNLINTKSDYNLLVGRNIDVEALTMRLFDSVRVVPNVSNNLSSLQKFQSEVISDKLSQLQNLAEPIKDDILSYVGFPKDFYAGSTSKWEVQRQSDRFVTKVRNYIKCIESTSINFVEYLMNQLGIKSNTIKINFIVDSASDLSDKLQRLELNTQAIRNLSEIVDAVNTIKRNPDLASPKLVKLVEDLVANIDTNLVSNGTIPESSIKDTQTSI